MNPVKALALPRGDWALVAGGAVLLALAYPPFHLFLPSFLCLVPVVWLIRSGAEDARPLRRHLVQGFWFGMIGNGLVLYWMVVALWHFTPLAGLGYALSMLVLGLYGAVLFSLTGWIVRRTRLSVLVVFPILWTVAEWVLGHQGDIRFPWLGLGTSLTGFPTAVQIADVVGARGVTYLLALANVALAVAWLERADRRRAVGLVVAVVAGVSAAIGYGLVRERTLDVRSVGTIAVLQPNIGSEEKWDAGGNDIVLQQLRLAERAIDVSQPELVVWPEAALPGVLATHPAWAAAVGALSRQAGTPQFLGAIHLEWRTADTYDYYNSSFLVDTLGRWDAQPPYHKRYLVPVTERVPFFPPSWFNQFDYFGGASPGDTAPIFEIAVGRFGALICYESAFEDLSRRYRADGADFIVNITNDAWFGRTSGPYQHAAHLVMRAIENRVGIARAANSGISEFVDPLGRTAARTPLYVETHRAETLMTTDVRTLHTRLGDWVGTTVLVLAVALVAFAWSRR
ncbi:MAG: apolipoprotein N-acyltransferase [Gemmatimonadales bacterium]